MRIDALDLHAFGPFKDQKLDLSNPGIHLIIGENGAGKTTARRAVSDLLFGIPSKTADDWLHGKDLKIAASLRTSEDATPLEVVRLRGRSKSLQGPTGEAVAEGELAKLLGGIDRERFESMFSLTQTVLRTGGREIARGGGELGPLLFEAGIGSTQVTALLQDLEEEAEGLFTPLGRQGKAINKKIGDHKSALKRAKDLVIDPKVWEQREGEMQQATERLETLKARRAEIRGETEKLEIYDEAIRKLAQRDQLEAQIKEIDVPIEVNHASKSQRELAEQKIYDSESRIAEARDEIDGLDEQLKSLQPTPELLGIKSEVGVLSKRLELLRGIANVDLPKAVKAHDDLVQRQSELESQKPNGVLENEDKPLRLPKASISQLRKLSESRDRLDRRQEEAAKQVETEESRVGELEVELNALPDDQNLKELRAASKNLERKSHLSERVEDALLELAQLEESLESEVESLPNFSGDLEQLGSLKLPLKKSLDTQQKSLEKLEGKCKVQEARVEALRRQLGEKEGILKSSTSSPGQASEQELDAARLHRDQGWRAVLAEWKEGNLQAGKDFRGRMALPAAYETAVKKSDRMADQLRVQEVENSQAQALTAEVAGIREDLERELESLEALEEEKTKLLSEWRPIWEKAGFAGAEGPEEVLEWRELVLEVRTKISERDHIQASLDRDRTTLEELRSALESELSAIDGTKPDQDADLTTLQGRAEELIERADTVQTERRALKKALEKANRDLKTANQAVKKADQGLQAWSKSWEKELKKAKLSVSAAPQEVEELIAVIEEMTDVREMITESEEDLKRLQEQVSRFLTESNALLMATKQQTKKTEDVTEATILVEQLAERAQEAEEMASTRRDLESNLKKIRKRMKREEKQLTEAKAALSQLCKKVGVKDPSELPPLEEKAEKRDTTLLEIEKLEAQIAERAGMGLVEISREVAELDLETISETTAKLQGEAADIEQEDEALRDRIAEIKSELQALDQSEAEISARSEADEMIRELRDLTEIYVKVQLTIALLRRTISDYQEEAEGPILKTASEIFPRLTLDRFEGLRAVMNDDGTAFLAPIRDGEEVEVEKLSEGEQDSLFLALRLAAIEYQMNEGMEQPLIFDDLFASLDDERAAAGFKQLSELADKTQILFFTHHAHLRDIASLNVPKDMLTEHEL